MFSWFVKVGKSKYREVLSYKSLEDHRKESERIKSQSSVGISCDICGKVLKNRHGLLVHKSRAHGAGQGEELIDRSNIQCLKCGERFTLVGTLVRHVMFRCNAALPAQSSSPSIPPAAQSRLRDVRAAGNGHGELGGDRTRSSTPAGGRGRGGRVRREGRCVIPAEGHGQAAAEPRGCAQRP